MKTNEAYIKSLTYKPGFSVEYFYQIDFDMEWLLIEARVPDVTKLPDTEGRWTLVRISQRYPIPRMFNTWPEQDKNEWVKRCFMALEIHELEEWLKKDGENLFDPHPELKNG